jgi:hypothetical protein
VTGFGKIIDFNDRSIDGGLYNINAALQLYAYASGPAGAFAAGTAADLLFTLSAVPRVAGAARFALLDHPVKCSRWLIGEVWRAREAIHDSCCRARKFLRVAPMHHEFSATDRMLRAIAA